MHQHSPQPCACTTLRKASRAVTRVYDARLAAHGLTTTQFAVLRNVDRAGAIALSRLAEQLVMDRTSLYRTIAPIERAGWLAVAPGAGRTRVAQLTDAGRAVMAAADPAWAAAQAELLGALGVKEWRQLTATLGRLTILATA